MWTIYQHKNTITGKSYIGLTVKSMQTRWKQHVRCAKANEKSHFHRALLLYGIDCWEHKILQICETLEEANLAEIKLIQEFDSVCNGYNMTFGGGGIIPSPETKEKLRISLEKVRPIINEKLRNKKHSLETREQMSKSHLGKKHSEKTKQKFLGRKVSDETKQKLRILHLGRKITEETRIKMCKSAQIRVEKARQQKLLLLEVLDGPASDIDE